VSGRENGFCEWGLGGGVRDTEPERLCVCGLPTDFGHGNNKEGWGCVLQCVLYCVAVCCSVLHCVAVFCNVLQCVAVC